MVDLIENPEAIYEPVLEFRYTYWFVKSGYLADPVGIISSPLSAYERNCYARLAKHKEQLSTMRDAYGYDPEETTTNPDNPFWDSTDFAHPAWFRGNDQGVLVTADRLKNIAETGVHRGTFGCEKLEAAAQVIKKLYYKANPGKGEPL